jgi:hypothetical protein
MGTPGSPLTLTLSPNGGEGNEAAHAPRRDGGAGRGPASFRGWRFR